MPTHDVVLLGIGHTNAHVLRMWRMQPIPDARLTCVSNFPTATYSGMLPGVLAGQYPPEAMEIDLVRLCAAAGARLILSNVTGLDRQHRELLFDDRPPLRYDVLSVGIGSVPSRDGLQVADNTLLPIKPMQTFVARLESRVLASGRRRPPDGAIYRAVIVGGGVGGVEIAFCLSSRLRTLLAERPFEITLVNSHPRLTPGTTDATAQRVQRELESRGVNVILDRRVTSIEASTVTLDNGQSLAADLILWATSAAAPPLLGRVGLPTDDDGFLLTTPALQSTADPAVFAVGDSGTIVGQELPKAGVYAVREGPILWENIQRALRGQPVVTYRPQRGFLKLINTGDGRAIGEYRGFTFAGRWAWRLKDRIDRKFMAMYQDYTPMLMGQGSGRPEMDPPQMRCAGCGGKIGGTVLSRALSRLEIPLHDSLLVGLSQPDDVALVRVQDGQPLAATTDFFAAPLDDPYLVGRMAALHAASDVLAKGARPVAALAIATIPEGPAEQQEQLLFELLAGGVRELKAMGATLAGGHTIEGPQLTIGYTILAEQARPLRAKGNLRAGDALILTKPLGTGVLLAAHMQALLKAGCWQPLLNAMLRSNQPAAELLAEFDVRAVTDVTGFGLAGHLLEMLRASKVAATLRLDSVPLLPGAAELLSGGMQSTLAPANAAAEREMDTAKCNRSSAGYAALFDPQTCGGLLIGVAREQAGELCRGLHAGGDEAACIVGEVATETGGRRLTILNSAF
ncbi:MAG TPA: selenide, water dikinase SelD [Pirellulaceae bacterium]|nr:selenide, water dikinase SelD [Pirellulaceae bacterium]